jgi:hypothetical protein
MSDYIYGAATMFLLSVTVSIIDKNIPNNLWYYVDLYIPFI